MNLFGLIGYPISKSFSQPYFTRKFADMGLSNTHEYRNFELKDISLFPEIIQVHPELLGLNVTIPHKQAVLAYLDEIDPTAAAIGAVNTILITNGKTIGYNTDAIGFQDDFLDFVGSQSSKVGPQNTTNSQPGLPMATYAKGRIQIGNDQDAPGSRPGRKVLDHRALVLGTGGASLAVIQAMKELDIPVTAVSRSAGDNKITYQQLSKDVLSVHRFIINCTPLGSQYQPTTCPSLPYTALTNRHFCYDLVYNPAESLFLRNAKNAGAATRNGLGMLHGQAEAAWKIWTNG